MSNLTKEELQLTRKCVKDALYLRQMFVSTLKPSIESGGYKQEPDVRRKYERMVAVEIPRLTALYRKLKGVKPS